MDVIRASVIVVGNQRYISIEIGEQPTNIPLTEDKSNEVKSAFNRLISRIKEGEFQIELTGVGDDLFSQVANEYISQLNREIKEVHGEMKHFGLVTVL